MRSERRGDKWGEGEGEVAGQWPSLAEGRRKMERMRSKNEDRSRCMFLDGVKKKRRENV